MGGEGGSQERRTFLRVFSTGTTTKLFLVVELHSTLFCWGADAQPRRYCVPEILGNKNTSDLISNHKRTSSTTLLEHERFGPQLLLQFVKANQSRMPSCAWSRSLPDLT